MAVNHSGKRPITVALDGPAGAGKSTVARLVARRLNYRLLDTGALYRAVAWLAAKQHVSFDDDAKLAQLAASLPIEFRFEGDVNRVFVAGEDVTSAIRTEDVSQGASFVSAKPAVRQALLDAQRRIASDGGVVLEGRDIGTVVCPNAEVKFFLDASVDERARRRFEELRDKGENPIFDDVLTQVAARDKSDRTRAIAPLRAADDAITLDCTSLSIDDVVERIVQAVISKST